MILRDAEVHDHYHFDFNALIQLQYPSVLPFLVLFGEA